MRPASLASDVFLHTTVADFCRVQLEAPLSRKTTKNDVSTRNMNSILKPLEDFRPKKNKIFTPALQKQPRALQAKTKHLVTVTRLCEQ